MFVILSLLFLQTPFVQSLGASRGPSNAHNACAVCGEIVKFTKKQIIKAKLDGKVADKDTVSKEIESLLCSDLQAKVPLASSKKAICSQITQLFFSAIYDFSAEGKLDGLEICTKIGICPRGLPIKLGLVAGSKKNKGDKKTTSNVLAHNQNAFKSIARLPKKSNEKVSRYTPCEMCVQTGDAILPYYDKLLEEELEEIIIHLCLENWEYPYTTFCDSIASQNVPLFVEAFKQGKSSYDLCVETDVCPPKKTKQIQFRFPKVREISTKKKFTGCEMCCQTGDVILPFYDTLVEEELAELVIEYCQKNWEFPYTLLCVNVAQVYVPLFVEGFKNGKTSYEVCADDEICPQPTEGKKLKIDEKKNYFKIIARLPRKLNQKKSYTPCEMCLQTGEAIVDIYDIKLEEELEFIIEQLCQEKWDYPYTRFCDAIASQYVPLFVSGFKEGKTVYDVCEETDVCPPLK